MKKVIISCLIVILLLGALAAAYIYISDIKSELLPPNASAGGVDIGNLTPADAKDKISGAYSGYSISIYDSFTQAELVFNDNINLWLDFEAAVDELFIQKSGFWISDLDKEYVSDAEGILRYDSGLLKKFTDTFVSEWNAGTEQPEDAYIILGEDCYELIGEVEGKLLNADSVYFLLLTALKDGINTVDLETCRVPFSGTGADEVQDDLQYLNTYADFRLEYDTGEVLDFRFLLDNDWLIFGGSEVRLAEYKVIEYIIGLGDTYDSDDLILDKPSESVQLIADVSGKAPVSRSMIFRDPAQAHDRLEYLRSDDTSKQISLTEFLDGLEIDLSDYLEIADMAEGWQYPHYLSENAFRYADYWSYNPDMQAGTVFALVNVNADLDAYTGIADVHEPGRIWLLVNKNYAFPEGFEPDDLVSASGSYMMRAEAAQAFADMRSDMRGQGYNLYVTSAYRSRSRQAEVHRDRVRSYGLERADMEAARAGHSEHQAGLAVDFFHRGDVARAATAGFERTGQYGWLLRYAHYYGFILRYPENYTEIHGNIFEPWHWRYVGVEIATAMQDKQIEIYEEFYGRYLAPDVLYAVRQIITEQRSGGYAIDYERYLR